MAASEAQQHDGELPIACSLDATQLGERERRWSELVHAAGTTRRATADGIEVRFRAGERTEHELQQLVAAERECCAWARWELHTDDGDLVMRVHAGNSTGAATLQSMFLPAD
ncbi:MAG TPA: hypothetical protein VFW09_03505 [Solirubrobacteraceae bacterium]|nr:hypothetical protein [Solirubrobacteraceae bacterium]